MVKENAESGSTYKPRITFDLFANQSATDPSFTLISQHKRYARKRGFRTYLCGTDESDYAAFALKYLIDELVDDGDDIVCVRVVDKDSDIASDFSIKAADYKMKARQVHEQVQEMLDGDNRPAVKVVIEFAVGKVGETIDHMVNLHTPISVVVGTRGKSLASSSFSKGSVSQYLYQHSPVPVIIVRPQEVRLKHLRKRQGHPSRQEYSSIVEDNNVAGSVVLEASQHEREAVAKAIGLPQGYAEWGDFPQPSGSRNNSKERKASGDLSRTELSETSDDEGGASLARALSTKSNADIDDDQDYAMGGGSFEDMPNFIPGLDNDSDMEDLYEVAGEVQSSDDRADDDSKGSANTPANGKENA
ncbi:MAG: hypothetical protein Q9217_002163 [Psora testacea]